MAEVKDFFVMVFAFLFAFMIVAPAETIRYFAVIWFLLKISF